MPIVRCEICGLRTGRVEDKKRTFMAQFPLDEHRCKQWVKITGKEDLAYVPIEKLHQLKHICGKHFRPQDFKKKKTQLRKNAVPSIGITAEPLSDEILRDFPLHLHKKAVEYQHLKFDGTTPLILQCSKDLSACIVQQHYYCKDNDTDNEQAQNMEAPEDIVQDESTENLNGEVPIYNLEAGPSQESEPIPELSSKAALGDAPEDTPKFGKNINDSLARLWTPLLTKGLDKDNRDKLIKENPIPENCPLLQAPKLNPEILAAVSDSIRVRDKRVESVQQQLGAGITALNKGLELLLEDESSRLQAVKHLSDCCRLLCDLHHIESEARKKIVTPSLDKSFTNIFVIYPQYRC